MLKEVGASGQISLGKKYAGQLFDMQVAADGAVTLIPVKVVPLAAAAQEELAVYKVGSASTTDPAATRAWADEHAAQIAQYNAWVTQREPYAQRVRRWREQGQGLPGQEGNS